MLTKSRYSKGNEDERVAAEYLSKCGLKILERNLPVSAGRNRPGGCTAYSEDFDRENRALSFQNGCLWHPDLWLEQIQLGPTLTELANSVFASSWICPSSSFGSGEGPGGHFHTGTVPPQRTGLTRSGLVGVKSERFSAMDAVRLEAPAV